MANAVVAVILLSLLPRGSQATGWFVYAPLADSKPLRTTVSQADSAIVVIPVALVVLNVLLVLVATRKQWIPQDAAIRRSRQDSSSSHS